MTIVTTASKVTLNGNGVTTLFPYSFEIPGATSTDQTNVIVTLTATATGTETVLTSGQYSITGINSPAGGNVTYPVSGTPLQGGNTITIQRNVPYIQTTNIPNQSAFFGTVLTNAYDYAMMCIQQLVTRLNYTLQFPLTDPVAPDTLPPATVRANGYLGFDAAGQPIIYVGPPSGGGGSGSSWTTRRVSAAGTTNATANDGALYCDASNGAQIIVLPDAATVGGKMYIVKKIDATANSVTVAGLGGSFDGNASFTLAQQYNALTVMAEGGNWNIINQL